MEGNIHSDILTAVMKIAEKRKFQVHVWSWKNGLASEYLRLSHKRIHVHELDEYIDEIRFPSEDWRGDVRTVPKHSVVVLDPNEKAWEINDFLTTGRYPFRRYTIKPEETRRPGATSYDIAIIHAMAAVGKSGLEYDAEEALYQEVSKGSAAHGLTVMTFLKYEQQYVRGNPNLSWKLSIPKDFREHPDDELRDPSPSTTSVDDKLSGQEPKRPDDGLRTVNGQAARLHQQAAKREVQNQRRCQ